MLVCRNVIVNGRRTSMRLDDEIWSSLREICYREATSINTVCSGLDTLREESGLSSALRSFVLSYYRVALMKYEAPKRTLSVRYDINRVLGR